MKAVKFPGGVVVGEGGKDWIWDWLDAVWGLKDRECFQETIYATLGFF